MNFPNNLKYTKNHEWIRIEGNQAWVGITDFAQEELGEIVFVDIPTVGDTLNKEEVFGSIEAVKTVSDIYLPLSGTVEEFNPELEEAPQLVNEDPYEKGWIVKLTLTNASEQAALMSAEEYRQLINK